MSKGQKKKAAKKAKDEKQEQADNPVDINLGFQMDPFRIQAGGQKDEWIKPSPKKQILKKNLAKVPEKVLEWWEELEEPNDENKPPASQQTQKSANLTNDDNLPVDDDLDLDEADSEAVFL